MDPQRRGKQNKRSNLLIGRIEKDGDPNDTKQDEFLPKYELEYGLPDIPIKPKLFKHIDSNPQSQANTIFKYEYSSIEIEQEDQATRKIYTDYNIGMRTNLVDRDIYKFPENAGQSSQQIKEAMSEKLKYVLSNKDNYDPYEGQKKMLMSKKIIIPSRFTAFDKTNKFGGKIEDPFKLNVGNAHEMKDRVFTHVSHQQKPEMRVKAISQIQDQFRAAGNFKVGMTKPGCKGVTAKGVYSVNPMLLSLPHKILHVINEDIGAIEDNMPVKQENGDSIDKLKKRYFTNNGQILVNFNDEQENEKKFALYRYDHEAQIPQGLLKNSLGKRSPPDNLAELEKSIQLEHVKNYSFSQHQNDAKEEFIIQFDKQNNQVIYAPIATKLALLKKKKLILQDETKVNQKFLQVMPRGLTLKEVTKMGQTYERNQTGFQSLQASNRFINREDMMRYEKNIQDQVNNLHSARIAEHRALFDEKVNQENYGRIKNENSEDDEVIAGGDKSAESDDQFIQRKSKQLKKIESDNEEMSNENAKDANEKDAFEGSDEADLF